MSKILKDHYTVKYIQNRTEQFEASTTIQGFSNII